MIEDTEKLAVIKTRAKDLLKKFSTVPIYQKGHRACFSLDRESQGRPGGMSPREVTICFLQPLLPNINSLLDYMENPQPPFNWDWLKSSMKDQSTVKLSIITSDSLPSVPILEIILTPEQLKHLATHYGVQLSYLKAPETPGR